MSEVVSTMNYEAKCSWLNILTLLLVWAGLFALYFAFVPRVGLLVDIIVFVASLFVAGILVERWLVIYVAWFAKRL
jgi:hypothetical protein